MVFHIGNEDRSTPPPAGVTTANLGNMAATYGVQLGGTTAANQGTIFLGYGGSPNKAPAAVRRGIFDAAPGSYGPKTSDLNTMLSDFEDMSKEEQRQLGLLLVLGGYNSGETVAVKDVGDWLKDHSLGDILMAYSNLLKDAETHFALGQKVTPDQLLNKAIAFRLPGWNGKRKDLNSLLVKLGVDLDGDESQAGTFTTTSKSKSLDFMDPMDAKALARGTLQNELGRDPTQAEYEDFIAAIHAAEAHDPSISTTTYTRTLDAEGNPTAENTNTVTHGGMTEAGYNQLATEKAQSNPNWAEWQAMGTYAPALFAALGPSVPGV